MSNICLLRNCNVCKYNNSNNNMTCVWCDSKDPFFMIQCKNCLKKYVGSTKRNFRTRMREHFQDIRSDCCITTVSNHFCNVCKPKHFSFKVLESNIENTAERLQKEHDGIVNHQSLNPNGLNERLPMTLPKLNINNRQKMFSEPIL